ncbi:DUF1453 domain-containing protein [Streptomyces sp. NPDC001848]|uniref:DUF1453 domain-containing protein n=1 Tax=Streptomyces sp. NPDC001848 TaxID=3364618 RepID=UPI00368E7C5D
MEIVLVVAAVGYLLVRRMAGEPAQGKRMLVLPAVLGLIGLSEVSGVVRTPSSVLYLAAAAAISVAFGALRGASVRISRHDGYAFVQYTGITVALWALNLAVGFGGKFALHSFDPKDAGTIGDGLLLTLGLGILAESLAALYRSMRRGYQVMWGQNQVSGWNTRSEAPRDHH